MAQYGLIMLESGNKIVFICWKLSDVELGGRTVFSKANVSLKPVKGSAVLWFNLKKNGEHHPMTEHGGCPVLIGHKWGVLFYFSCS